MDPMQFDDLVRAALADLPEQFLYALENVVIVVNDEPTPEQLSDVHVDHDVELFGLYEGLPLTERGEGYTGLPDRIVIFRMPSMAIYTNEPLHFADSPMCRGCAIGETVRRDRSLVFWTVRGIIHSAARHLNR